MKLNFRNEMKCYLLFINFFISSFNILVEFLTSQILMRSFAVNGIPSWYNSRQSSLRTNFIVDA